jgi:hypothetical protein
MHWSAARAAVPAARTRQPLPCHLAHSATRYRELTYVKRSSFDWR